MWPRFPDASYPSVINTVLPRGRARQVGVAGQTSPIGGRSDSRSAIC
ncbi:3-methylmercaptopropionyl-CoA dehydrogenase (DmdC) [Actinoplanes sp. N902-109]|nr:3-methylmercaptopropionyl-CoA dehydrogenase (DmdC) [Actinoplanes sp. N902-109]